MNKTSEKIRISDESMRPLILNGDEVFFKKIQYIKIKIDDIVVVRKNQKIFIRRVVYKKEKYLITKGDANYYSDGKIYPKNIIGVVFRVKREAQIYGIEDYYLFQSTAYFQEIVNVKKTFEKEKIDFVFLKGLLLHLYYEKSPPRRIYRDCDILVAKSQFNKAKKIFSKMGYVEFEENILPGLQEKKERQPEVNFLKIIDGVKVIFDLHQEIVFMAQMTGLNNLYSQKLTDKFSKELLDEKERVVVLGETFPFLTINNLIIYTALHLYHHNFVGTFRYELMKKFFKSKQIDYEKIANKIKFYRVENFVYPCFLFLEKYYEAKVPDILMNKITPCNSKLNYIKKIMDIDNIFDDGKRLPAGIKRFGNLFFLSPNPLYKKGLIFFNPQVFYAIITIIRYRMAYFFRFQKTND